MCATVLALAVGASAWLLAQERFPVWRGSNLEIAGDWQASPIVAVGDVIDAAPYGEQAVRTLPWPMSPDVHTLYWCEGDFRLVAMVKGKMPPIPRKYLWATSQPGCKLWYGEPSYFEHLVTRVWFMREEEGVLRPTFDGGTHMLFGFSVTWEEGPVLPARERLGALLLTPEANSDSLDDYAHYLWNAGDIACDVLGKAECARRIRSLALVGNKALTEASCNYLRGQLGETCAIR
jgi:hypothetical protein